MIPHSRVRSGLRILAAVAFLASAGLPTSLPGLRSPQPVLAGSGGCSPSSSTCYVFDISLSGTGFGTYRTMGEDGTYSGRVVCEYGNEAQTGTCGWGYEAPSAGDIVDVFYRLTPEPGSQACDATRCFGADDVEAYLLISGNYAELQWRFELIQKFQIDVVIEGPGTGTVKSEPVGIDCPGDCDDLYAANYPVVLTATPSAGSVFGGWSGDYCEGTSKTCVITTDFLQSVTATFNVKATAPPPTKKPTPRPTAEPTDEPTEEPTEEVTPGPAESTTTPGEPLPSATLPTASTAAGSDAAPSPTAPASTAPTSAGGNTPLIVGLAIALVALAGGALFFARRGRAAG